MMPATAVSRSVFGRVPFAVTLFIAVDCALVAAYLLDWEIGGLYWKVTALIDPKGVANIVTWYASAQLFLSAYLLLLFARDRLEWRARRSWALLLLPVGFAVLSLEEIADLHGYLAYKIAPLLPPGVLGLERLSYGQLALGFTIAGGLAAAAIGTMLRGYLSATPAATAKFIVALALAVLAAGIDGPFGWGGTAAIRVARVSAAELGQLLAMTLAFWASLELPIDMVRRAVVPHA